MGSARVRWHGEGLAADRKLLLTLYADQAQASTVFSEAVSTLTPHLNRVLGSLKGLATGDAIGKQIGSGVVALVSTADGKASIVVGVSLDLTDRFNAVELVRAASAAVGGKGGGGRPDMAQAGGPNGGQADAALAAVRGALAA